MLQPITGGREAVPNYGIDERLQPAGIDSLFDLREPRAILRRRKWVAITAFTATVLAALLYVLLIPPKYQATALILSDPRQERVVDQEAVLGIGSDGAAVESQVELLSSPELAQQVMQKLGLFSDPEFTKPSMLSELRQQLFGAKGPAGEENDAIDRFRQSLDVSRKGLTYILAVTFTASEAAKSAHLANAVANTYLEDQIKQKKEATAGAGEWLNSHMAELRHKVNKSERAVADFKAKHGIVDLGNSASELRLDRQQLDQTNQELINARAAVAGATAKVEQMKRLVKDAGDLEGLSAEPDSPIIQELRKQYAQVVGLEANYAETLGPQHPTLLRVRAQVSRLRGEITREAKRILAAAINEQEAAQKKVAALTASLATSKRQLEENDRVAVQLQELQRQADADNALFTQFLMRAKEVAEREGMQKPDARVIARAVPPTKAKGPSNMVIMALGLAGGFLMALFAAFAADKLDTSFRTRAQLEEVLGIPCLALCPLFRRGSFWRTSKSQEQFKESIQLLRHEIEAADPSRRPLVVMITSSLKGEGKSTIAAALADSAARGGQRTLLIDADSKAQALTRRLAPRSKRGLYDVLRGDVALDDALITHSSFTKLLPVGKVGSDATASLTKTGLASLWVKTSHAYDIVLIDAPPVLASVEPVMLEEAANIVLLVVKWGRTSHDDVIAACDTIRRGREAMGAVLNEVDPRALRSSGRTLTGCRKADFRARPV
jgi:succinoglycan biosynthesis transport protein ExoP